MRFTTQKAALCDWLLNGNLLTIMEAFEKFGITNLPREIGRSVERAFGVTVNKYRTRHTNMFGEGGSHFVYSLSNDYNSFFRVQKHKRSSHRKGIKLMQKYVEEHSVHEVFRDSWMTTEEQKTAKFYADEAAKRVIPRCGKTTSEIIRDSSYTKEQIAEQKRKKK